MSQEWAAEWLGGSDDVAAGVEPETTVELVVAAPRQDHSVLVVGVCGGAGTTTTALNIASAMFEAGVAVAAVDSTCDGGDLIPRGCGYLPAAGQWVGGDVLWGRRAFGDRAAEDLAATSTHQLLVAANYRVVYDGGSALHARHLSALLEDPNLNIVVTVPSRGDGVNRLPGVLEQLELALGSAALAAVTIAVIATRPGTTPVADHLRAHLSDEVRAVCEVGHDPHLTSGGEVVWTSLAPTTREQYEQLVTFSRHGEAATQ